MILGVFLLTIALWLFRRSYKKIDWRCGWIAPIAGVAVFVLWIALDRWLTASASSVAMPTALAALLVVALTLALLVFMSYKTYSKYLKWVALVLFSYMITCRPAKYQCFLDRVGDLGNLDGFRRGLGAV